MASAFAPTDDVHVWVTRNSVTHVQRRIACCTLLNVVLVIVIASFVTMQLVSGNTASQPSPRLALSSKRCDLSDITWESGLTRIDRHELIILGDTMYRSGEFNATHEECFEATYASLPLLYDSDVQRHKAGRRLHEDGLTGGIFCPTYCATTAGGLGNAMSTHDHNYATGCNEYCSLCTCPLRKLERKCPEENVDNQPCDRLRSLREECKSREENSKMDVNKCTSVKGLGILFTS